MTENERQERAHKYRLFQAACLIIRAGMATPAQLREWANDPESPQRLRDLATRALKGGA